MNTLIINELNLSYSNNQQAIKDVSLQLENGMFGLLGPNGAGKSSLMKTIIGLQKPSSGTIMFNGENIVQEPEHIKKHLGFLPQDFGVYQKASAYDLLNHIAILKGIADQSQRKQQILELLERVNLSSFQNKEVHKFSGGMRQRFGIAQALLGDPKIIIVDEPTAGLDPEERNRFNLLLNNISKNMIIIFSSHIVEDIQNLCPQVAIMNQGKILTLGNPKDLVQPIQGKLWGKSIDIHEEVWYKEDYRVISQKLVNGKLMISVMHDEQPKGFESIQPSLEHVYFSSIETNLN